MFVTGLAFGGRLFPVRLVEPLVLLLALAEWGLALPRRGAALGGFGDGDVVSSPTSTAIRFSSWPAS